MKKLLAVLLLPFTFCLSPLSAQTGKWSAVKNLAPHYHNGGLTLLTDGTVICHTTDGGGNGTGWDRLTPDSTGSYANGTWTSITPMVNDRLYFSTQVLQNGDVYVAGGEYGAGGSNGEVYHPLTDTWTPCGALPGGYVISDGNSEILYNGKVLEGPQLGPNTSYDNLLWDTITLNYSVAPNSIYNHDEAQWVKLQDSTIVFIGINTNGSNRYNPRNNTWINDGAVPVYIWDGLSEAGPGLMLPNGKSIVFGATPANTIYTPSGNLNPGTWSVADSFPMINGTPMGQSDAPAAMMVNGKILCAIAPYTSSFSPPTYFVEYDYLTNTFTRVMDTIPGGFGDSLPTASYQVNMIDLPDGNVLVSNYQQGFSNQYWIYTPGSSPIPQGKPTITSIIPQGCPDYKITGKLFNGISEGAAYGDDWQMETNYPLVRFSNGSRVYYARTSNWNRIGAVRTDSLMDTAVFTLPAIPAGTYSVVVIANGFASNPVLFTVFGAKISTHTEVLCYGGTGNAAATTIGGIAPYTYSWAPGGQTNSLATGLSAGTYTVNITDNNGCTSSSAVTITQPAAALSGSVSGSNAACNNMKDGSAFVIANGGSSPYTYLWSNGNTTSSISGLSAGVYSVTITDSHNCATIIKDTIKQPNAMTVIKDSIASTNPSGNCNGLAAVTVSGGSAPYTYSWSPGGQTTDTINGQCAGTYCCTITDYNGCTHVTCITIGTPEGIGNITSNSSDIFIYPNPSNGRFTIQSSVISGKSSVEIYNILGSTIYKAKLNSANTEINLEKQPSGIYLYRVIKENGGLIGEGKIIIQK